MPKSWRPSSGSTHVSCSVSLSVPSQTCVSSHLVAFVQGRGTKPFPQEKHPGSWLHTVAPPPKAAPASRVTGVVSASKEQVWAEELTQGCGEAQEPTCEAFFPRTAHSHRKANPTVAEANGPVKEKVTPVSLTVGGLTSPASNRKEKC